MVTRVNEFFVEQKDNSPIVKMEGDYGITQQGNKIDTASKLVKVMGPDPYFNNVPKEQWPNGSIKLTNTELFQSINPLFIVLLTLFFVPFFDYLRKRQKEPTTGFQVCNGYGYIRFVCIGNGFCNNVSALYLYPQSLTHMAMVNLISCLP
jgi:hypothetical protein